MCHLLLGLYTNASRVSATVLLVSITSNGFVTLTAARLGHRGAK